MVPSNIKPTLLDRFTQFVSNKINKPSINLTVQAAAPKVWRGLPIYPNPNAVRYIEQGYCGNATLYTIISTASRKFGFLPRKVYSITDSMEAKALSLALRTKSYSGRRELRRMQRKAYNEQVVNNKFAELLQQPNPEEGQDAFYEKCLTYYMATGETFIHLNRGDDMFTYDPNEIDTLSIKMTPVKEMRVLPSQYVDIIGDEEDVFKVDHYQLDMNGKKVPIRKEDIIHWKRPNPKFDAYTRVHMRGLSPLEPANKLVTQDDSATDASVAMHQNDGAKAVIFNKQLTDLDSTQKSQLESVVNRKINNRDLKGAVATMQGDWGMLDLSMSSVDMQLEEAKENVFVRLCNLYGINPDLFLGKSTFQNIQDARQDLLTGLLLPLACSLRDEMNRALLPAFGLDKTFTHDIDASTLAELQEEFTSKVTALAQATWMTLNEKREAMNLERLNDANMDKILVPNNQILLEDAVMTDLQNSFENDNGATNNANSGSDGSNL